MKLKKTKDAYDIAYCLRNYPGGVDAMAVEFRSTISNPIVASGVELLKGLFASPDSIGPVAYAMVADDFGGSGLDEARGIPARSRTAGSTRQSKVSRSGNFSAIYGILLSRRAS